MRVVEAIVGLPPVAQVLLATGFTWGMTALGAALVFLTKEVKRWVLDAMLGFAAGVMIAASYFSLLAPSVEFAEAGGISPWIPAVVGFLGGGIFLRGLDWVLPHLHPGAPMREAEGIKTSWRRSVLLVSAITLHNIPEGLAVGVAFGAVAAGMPGVPEASSIAAATALAVGIGLQNFPEGTAVSMPLRREGVAPGKSFFFGQLSAVVEPVAGVIGVLAVTLATPLLPYALAFAAGAMIFVVAEELIPESQKGGHADLATMSLMVGFAVMMTLDVAFG
ncbi:MAG: ZIP family metal transporter [Actinomycetota bacterium]|nr:ZIP family metal transporter [Actinomycetota bacterium]